MTTPRSLPFEYPFQWDNESLREGAGVTEEAAATLRQRDRDLEDFLATLGGGGAFFVAASDASATSRAVAHYICDGTNDEEEINAAIADCFAIAIAAGYSAYGNRQPSGRVLLSEGTFHIGGDGIVYTGDYSSSAPANLTLQGQGMAATVVKHATAAGVYYKFGIQISGSSVTCRDFTLDTTGVARGGYGFLSYGQSTHVRNMRFRGLGYDGVRLDGAYSLVEGCEFHPSDDANAVHTLYLVGNQIRATNNYFYFTPREAIYTDSTSDRTVLMGNVVEKSNYNASAATAAIVVGTNSVVVGNVCEDYNAAAATISSGAGSQVANNVLL